MRQRLPTDRSRAHDCGGLHELAFESRAVLPDLEFHNARVPLGRTFADADERSTSGFRDVLILSLCADAGRVIVIVLYRFATRDNDRSLACLRERFSGWLRHSRLFPAVAPAIVGK